MVPWLNANLSSGDRVLVAERQLNYYIEPPLYYAAPTLQTLIDLRDATRDVRRQWTQMRGKGITHLLLVPGLGEPTPSSALWRLGQELVAAGCAEVAVSMPVRMFLSRTLPTLGAHEVPADVLKLLPDRCQLDRLPAG